MSRRSWQTRGRLCGARKHNSTCLIFSLAFVRAMVEAYLRDMADTDRSLARQIAELSELIRQYGPEAIASAIEKASAARPFGADYVANLVV